MIALPITRWALLRKPPLPSPSASLDEQRHYWRQRIKADVADTDAYLRLGALEEVHAAAVVAHRAVEETRAVGAEQLAVHECRVIARLRGREEVGEDGVHDRQQARADAGARVARVEQRLDAPAGVEVREADEHAVDDQVALEVVAHARAGSMFHLVLWVMTFSESHKKHKRHKTQQRLACASLCFFVATPRSPRSRSRSLSLFRDLFSF